MSKVRSLEKQNALLRQCLLHPGSVADEQYATLDLGVPHELAFASTGHPSQRYALPGLTSQHNGAALHENGHPPILTRALTHVADRRDVPAPLSGLVGVGAALQMSSLLRSGSDGLVLPRRAPQPLSGNGSTTDEERLIAQILRAHGNGSK
jgi:hypothetical protein